MISVIIPTYNRAATIERSARSVLDQTYEDLELIVVDDCSTDNTREIVSSLNDSRIRYVRLEQNSGACIARNRGIELAKGAYIAFQDSDDAWHKTKLEEQLAVMRDKGADVCICQLNRCYVDESRPNALFPDKDGDRFLSHKELSCGLYVSTQTILARREAFQNCVFDPKVKRAQDYDWAIRASRNHSFYFLKKPLVDQYLQADSITMSGTAKIVESREYFLEKYRDEVQADPQFEIYQLNVITRAKVFLGMKPIKEMKRIYALKPNLWNFAKMLLAGTPLMKTLYKAKGYDL